LSCLLVFVYKKGIKQGLKVNTMADPEVQARMIAVAIEAGANPNALPKVVASGRGMLAEQILRLAFDNNVKVREDADLAELLGALSIDHAIPAQAIIPVAEILARVFEANARIDHESYVGEG
jgi:flagellar biosynthesis protein